MAVQAEVRYLNDEWRDRIDVPQIGDRASRRANTSKHTVTIHDARPGLERGELGLDSSCFTLLKFTSAVQDFQDDAQVRAVYYPEIIGLAKRVTGAAAVFITQHVARTEDTEDFNKAYARFLHCDYSLNDPHAAARRVLARQGVNPADYDGADFAWYNTWQPFDNRAIKNPLALVDAASLAPRDIVEYQYTGYARASESAIVATQDKSSIPLRNPAHRFYYVSAMAPDEVLFFSQLDTRKRGWACPHTSFENPSAPADAPPRRSIEMRLLAVFPNNA